MSYNYEMMYILRPDLSEEQVQQEISKYQTLLSDYKADDILIKNLGKRRLAYPIKKYTDGVYVQVNYSGDGKQVAPLERSMRLSDEVIRYLTLKLKQTVILDPSEETATPILEETATPILEETATPILEETATPVLEETATPVLEETATPVLEETATPILEETVLEEVGAEEVAEI